MRYVAINFEHLDINDAQKTLFKDRVLEVMREKYQGTNIQVVEDGNLANQLGISDTVRHIHIHNDSNLDQTQINGQKIETPNDIVLGSYDPETGYCEVNIQDILSFNRNHGNDIDIVDLAEQTGTVASHEGFHIFGPIGHSIQPEVNLMSDGRIYSKELFYDNGSNLEFTELQKDFLRAEFDITGYDLENLETFYQADMPRDIDDSNENNSDYSSDDSTDEFLDGLDGLI